MESLYLEARQFDSKLPTAERSVITTFHLARIIAETGPLSDFSSLRKLIRYAGLNLREKAEWYLSWKNKTQQKRAKPTTQSSQSNCATTGEKRWPFRALLSRQKRTRQYAGDQGHDSGDA